MFRRLLLFLLLVLARPALLPASEPPRLPVLQNEQAWSRLLGATGQEQALPAWARMLAGPLPFSTARMLELDALHRSGDRLDARTRSLARWAAADANGCAYNKAVAVADYRRATASQMDVGALAQNPDQLCAFDRATVSFARKMMREAYRVTDEEVKQLLDLGGEERLVALVALLAHASFQDRVFLALNIEAGADAALPPVTAHFGQPAAPSTSHPTTAASQSTSPDEKDQARAARPDWLALREGLKIQQERPGRIRVPSREHVIARIGANHPGAWQNDINWSRVCYGFQPELTDAWFNCASAFRQESQLDRILQNNIFWVVTRSVHCFY